MRNRQTQLPGRRERERERERERGGGGVKHILPNTLMSRPSKWQAMTQRERRGRGGGRERERERERERGGGGGLHNNKNY